MIRRGQKLDRPPTQQERETLLALEAAATALTAATLARQLGIDYPAVRERLKRLAGRRLVARENRGRAGIHWRITAAGAAAAKRPAVVAPPLPAGQSRLAGRPLVLTPLQAATLAVVRGASAEAGGGCRTVEIARRCGIVTQAANDRLRRLERLGLVERDRQPAGRTSDLLWRPVALPGGGAATTEAAPTSSVLDAEIWLGRFGGAPALARRLGLCRSTVAQWAQSGIPDHWLARLRADDECSAIEAELDRRLAATPAGQPVEYWRGHLALDIENGDRPDTRRHARAAQAWARRHAAAGTVALTQARHGEGDFTYLAVKSTAVANGDTRHAA